MQKVEFKWIYDFQPLKNMTRTDMANENNEWKDRFRKKYLRELITKEIWNKLNNTNQYYSEWTPSIFNLFPKPALI